MSRVNPAELPGSMAVLGIVIEQPNDTVSHIGHCLGQRFSRARFARSTAHSSLPRLAHSGRVRRTHLERGNDRSLDRYEATAGGPRGLPHVDVRAAERHARAAGGDVRPDRALPASRIYRA